MAAEWTKHTGVIADVGGIYDGGNYNGSNYGFVYNVTITSGGQSLVYPYPVDIRHELKAHQAVTYWVANVDGQNGPFGYDWYIAKQPPAEAFVGDYSHWLAGYGSTTFNIDQVSNHWFMLFFELWAVWPFMASVIIGWITAVSLFVWHRRRLKDAALAAELRTIAPAGR